MLVRLLLAVLTVAGPMPVGVCTCAAAGGAPPPASRVAAEPSPAPAKTCSCKRHAPQTADPADGTSGHADWCDVQPERHDHHDRDCPSASPRPAVTSAVPTSTADLPADPSLASADPIHTPTGARPCPPARPHAGCPPLPLYLSLCSLRI